MQYPSREIGLRIALALVGAAVLVTGVNVGFGGIATLGLQGPTDFFRVADIQAFQAQDSHVRFLGGLWLGIGLLFAAAVVRLNALRPAVCVALALVIVGGLSRLSGDPGALLGQSVGPSFAAELLLMPALLWWTWRGGRST